MIYNYMYKKAYTHTYIHAQRYYQVQSDIDIICYDIHVRKLMDLVAGYIPEYCLEDGYLLCY